jgi:ADP-ribose pyrophosphatase YjhB (NUDIX family)
MNTVSAGGVIMKKVSDGWRVLLVVGSDGNALLPKGHAENDETLRQTVAREIEEEIGLNNLLIGEEISSYVRDVPEYNETKNEHYFLVTANNVNEEQICIEEGKDWKVRWFEQNNLPDFYIPQQKEITLKAFEKILKTK